MWRIADGVHKAEKQPEQKGEYLEQIKKLKKIVK